FSGHERGLCQPLRPAAPGSHHHWRRQPAAGCRRRDRPRGANARQMNGAAAKRIIAWTVASALLAVIGCTGTRPAADRTPSPLAGVAGYIGVAQMPDSARFLPP